MNEGTKSRFEVVVTTYVRNKNRADEIKKHSMTSPGVQFKEFSLMKQKIDWESHLEKKSIQKIKKTNSKNQI